MQGHGHEDELHFGLEGVLVENIVPEKGLQHEVDDHRDLARREDENLKWRSLSRVLVKDLLEKLKAVFDLHLLPYHCMQQEVHDGHERADLLIGELVARAEVVVDVVEVEDDLVDLAHLLGWRAADCLQVEDGRQDLALLAVAGRFAEVFGLVLVQGSVQEEVWNVNL